MSDNTLHLTPEVVAQYKDFLVNPQKYNCHYKPLHECFVEGDHYEPQDKLYDKYIEYIKKPLPKFMFYIIMREEYPDLFGADEWTDDKGKWHRGDLGYKLKFNI